MFDHQERAGEAHIDHLAELLHGQVDDGAEAAEPGAVDHRLGLRPVEQGGDRLLVGDIDVRRAVRGAEFLGARVGAVGIAVGQGDGVINGQRLRGRPADAGGGADHHSLAGHVRAPSGRGSPHLAVMAPQGSA